MNEIRNFYSNNGSMEMQKNQSLSIISVILARAIPPAIWPTDGVTGERAERAAFGEWAAPPPIVLGGV